MSASIAVEIESGTCARSRGPQGFSSGFCTGRRQASLNSPAAFEARTTASDPCVIVLGRNPLAVRLDPPAAGGAKHGSAY
jgi:hypothetical protein